LTNHYFPSGDRELFALGSSNLIGAIFGGYASYGSLPRSKIQAIAGAKTTLTGFFTALLVLSYSLLLGNIFGSLPHASLAAVVFVAAYGLIEFDEIAFLFRMRNFPEIFKFLLTYFFTIFFDANTGIVLCLLLAGLVIIRRSTSLNVSLLGEVQVADPYSHDATRRSAYVDMKEHPEAHVMERVLAIQIRGALEFFNASRIARRIEMLMEALVKFKTQHSSEQSISDFDPDLHSDLFFIRSAFPPDNHVSIILDFSSVEDMDSSAVWILLKIIKMSKSHAGSCIYFSGLHPFQVELFERSKLLDILGRDLVVEKVEDAVARINASSLHRSTLRRNSVHHAMKELSFESLRETSTQ
jgi:MFS superfamily sulfate permease-like transporter